MIVVREQKFHYKEGVALNKRSVALGDYYLKFQKTLSLYKEKIAFFLTFIIGVISIVGGFIYGIGSFPNLGRGAYPVFVGLIISVLSIFLFFSTAGEETKAEGEAGSKTNNKRIMILLLVLALYVLLVNQIGFLILSFLLLMFLQKLMGQTGWRTPVVISVITVIVFWILFKKWLDVQLPDGLFKF
jgi:putative tricarboxylic transport membrane protein